MLLGCLIDCVSGLATILKSEWEKTSEVEAQLLNLHGSKSDNLCFVLL